MTAPAEDLLTRVAQLEATLAAVISERDRYRALYEELRLECEKLRRGLLGQKAERLPEDERQLSLGILSALLGKSSTAPEPPAKPVREHTRRPPTGRKPLPEHLPRVRIELIPHDVQLAGLDQYERIGAETSEVLERRPASTVVVEVTRPKYRLKTHTPPGPTRILIAETPSLPIERGRAGPGILADTIVRRWQDHQPLHRLERIFAREGVELNRSTICGWHEAAADLVHPLVAAMHADALQQPVLCTDATGVLVQAKEQCRRGHFWVLVAPGKHVLFQYSARHTMEAVDALLPGYKGYVVADAHTVYDHLYATGDVTEVGCWAHLRRYFYKSLGSEPERATEAIALIGELFRIEREIADARRGEREAVRHERSRPVVERFFAWRDEQAPLALESTPLWSALGYANRQRQAFCRFLEDGRLPLHNNRSELELRRQVIGRRYAQRDVMRRSPRRPRHPRRLVGEIGAQCG